MKLFRVLYPVEAHTLPESQFSWGKVGYDFFLSGQAALAPLQNFAITVHSGLQIVVTTWMVLKLVLSPELGEGGTNSLEVTHMQGF